MNILQIVKRISLHVSVICSFVCITAEILDWYNPFMDFSGHILYVKICLYVAVLLSALTTVQTSNRFSPK